VSRKGARPIVTQMDTSYMWLQKCISFPDYKKWQFKKLFLFLDRRKFKIIVAVF
jgi:hypothetical protein